MSPTIARLAIIITSSILSFTLADPTTPSLPPQILSVLPECAHDCLGAFVQEELSACSRDPTSLYCLCVAQSANGYTFGEGALACVADECPWNYVNGTSVSALYEACSEFQDAVPNTHSVLVASQATSAPETARILTSSTVSFGDVVLTTPTSSPLLTTTTFLTTSTTPSTTSFNSTTFFTNTTISTTMTSTASGSTSTDPITSLSLDTSIPPTPPLPTYPTTQTLAASTSLTQNAAAATSSSASEGAAVLNKGQVAGIAVAGVFTTAIAAGLLIFIFCRRKAREKRIRHASDGTLVGEKGSPRDLEQGPSGSDGVQAFLPETPLIPASPAPPRERRGGNKAHQFLGLPAAPNQHRQSWWNRFGRNSKPPPPPPPKTEVVQTRYLAPSMRDVSSEPSPNSVMSYRTTSQLLPDKPSYRPDTLQVYEKRCSGETTQGLPIHLGQGVGLRVISPTPEPQNQPLRKGWPQADSSQPAMHGQPPMQGPALASKLSDPFIARTSDQHQQQSGLVPAFRASRNDLPRLQTFGERDARRGLPSQSRMSQGKVHQPAGIPNFRTLVNPHTAGRDAYQPPQLPQADPFTPLTPGFTAVMGTTAEAQAQNHQQQKGREQGSIMSRPRGSTSPFFSSQQSQWTGSGQPRRDRTRRSARTETYYTTSSETEFEDDEPVSGVSKDERSGQHPGPAKNKPVNHVSVNGIAELPSLSPVTESPISKKSRSSGSGLTHTPSPLHSGSSPSLKNNVVDSPLSKVRYPEVPGTGVSPKREVKQVNLVLDNGIHLSPKMSPSRTPGARSAATFRTDYDDLYDSDTESPLPQTRPRLQPSPLRPARPAQENLREAAATSAAVAAATAPAALETKAEEPVELSSEPSSSAKFHSAAARLTASSAGIRAPPERGLGNWPVQPVRPNLRNTLIPAPIGVPAHAGSQPATPIEDAFSPTSPAYQPAVAISTNSRVLLPGSAAGRVMHAPALTQTQIPAPTFAQRASQFPSQGYAVDWRPQPPQQNHQRVPSESMPVLQQASQQHQPDQPYSGPRLSMGPSRYAHAPSRETERERVVRVELQRLRAREQGNRRDREKEQARINEESQRAALSVTRSKAHV